MKSTILIPCFLAIIVSTSASLHLLDKLGESEMQLSILNREKEEREKAQCILKEMEAMAPKYVTVELTKDSKVMPPVHLNMGETVHIISDKENKLIDVRVISLDKEEPVLSKQ